MSGLIPEQRMDKNGVLTTRHVRAYNDAIAQLGKFPKPVIAKSDFVIADGTAPVMEIVELQVTRLPETTSDEEIREVLSTLHGQTPVILDRLRIGAQTINKAVLHSLATRDFALLNNMAVLGELSVGPDRNSFEKYVGGLHHYPHLWGNIDLTKSTESEIESARALVYASFELHGFGYGRQYNTGNTIAVALDSVPLTTLLSYRAKDAERITSLLIDRALPVDTDEDIVHIVDLLDSSIEALNDGAL